MGFFDTRGQGTIEYLVIIAIVIVISLVVVGLTTNIFGSSVSNIGSSSSKVGSSVDTSGISILDAAVDVSGNGIVRLSNLTGERVTLTKVSVVSGSGAQVDNNYDSSLVASSDSVVLSLANLQSVCPCLTGETKKNCTFVVSYVTLGGLTKTSRITSEVDCVSSAVANGNVVLPADFVPPIVLISSPTSNSTASTSRVTFSYTATDNNSVKQCKLAINGTDVNTTTTSPFNTLTYQFATNATYAYDINCLDYSNNVGNAAGNLIVNFDEQKPTIVLLSPADNNITRISLTQFSFRVTDNNSIRSCHLDINGTDRNTIINVTNNSSNTIDYNFAILGYNSYNWDINCIDYQNNSDTNGTTRRINYSAPLSFSAMWARGTNYSVGNGSDEAYSVAVDSLGNVFVAGYYNGDLNVGGIILPDYSGSDFFVVKYNSSGNVVWAKSNNNSAANSNDYAKSVAVDLNGNVYVAGSYDGDLNVGGTILPNYSGSDLFVVKYDSSGNVVWVKSNNNSAANGNDSAYSVAVDLSGNVYVTGQYEGDLNFSGTVLPNYTSGDFFVVKYNSSGTVVWAKGTNSSAGNGYDYARSVAVDASSNVYVAGYYDGDLNVGGTILSDYASNDFFVMKYNSSGAVVWAKSNSDSAGNDDDGAYSVAVDLSGNVYIAGHYWGDLNVGGTILSDYTWADFFVTKYDSSGNIAWVKGTNNSAANTDDYARSVAVDLSGNVYVAGFYYGDFNFAGTTLPDYANYDFFVAKYNSSGNMILAKGTNSSEENGDEKGYSVAVDSSSNVYVAGYYWGDLNVGGTVLPNYAYYAGTDFFVTKYGYQ